MNFKKFKKSLVSIVLGSSLFLGNGGVICQQPRAWLTDEFFTNAKEKYKDDQNMKLLLIVSEFLSDLGQSSPLNTGFLPLKKRLLDEPFGLKLYQNQTPALKSIILYLEELETLPDNSNKLRELTEKLGAISDCIPSDDICLSGTINDYLKRQASLYTVWNAADLLYASALPFFVTENHQDLLMGELDVLRLCLPKNTKLGTPERMISVLYKLFCTSETEL